MNYNTKRRIAALFAVPVLLLTAACGSDSEKDGASDGTVAEVKGKFGAQPDVVVPKDAKAADKTVIETVTEGSGATVKKGDFVRLDWTVEKWQDDKPLGGTWGQQTPAAKGVHPQSVERLGQPSQQLPEKVLNAVEGKKAGSRILVQGTAGELVGESLNPQSGLKATDTLVWVVDVAGAATVDSKAEAKGAQAAPEAGMPEVKAPRRPPRRSRSRRGRRPPPSWKQQVLIKGTGPKVEAGQGLVAQYTGVKWEDGKKFDSSWDHGAPPPSRSAPDRSSRAGTRPWSARTSVTACSW